MKITHFVFKNRDKELHLSVKPHKNGCRCPECGRRGRIVRQTSSFRCGGDLTLMGMKPLFWYAPKEIDCSTHVRVQETLPWTPGYLRILYRLEWRICTLCQIMTQKATDEILKMLPSTLSSLLHRLITRVRDGHRIQGMTTLGVDEIGFLKEHKFATLVYVLDHSRVLWVGLRKGREIIDRFFNDALSAGQKACILWGSCDMIRSYTEAIKHATRVIDHFHVVKALNQAVNELREDEWCALDTRGRKAINGLQGLLSLHSRNRTKGHTYFLTSLRNANHRIHRAWVFKDEFEHIWNYRYRGSAETFPKRWMTAALCSRIPSLRQFVGTVRNHVDNIVAFTDRNLTRAVGEGLNCVIKIVKNRASGYRNLDSFAGMIYLAVGDLDIPAHISSQLRTL